MLKPKCPNKISLADLKACKMTSLFFNIFFNVNKYMNEDESDPYESATEFENRIDVSE